MHIRRSECDVAQGWRLERIAIFRVLGDRKASHIVRTAMGRRNPEIVVLVVSKVGTVMAFRTGSFADKENQAALLRVGKCGLVAHRVPIKARVGRNQRALKSSDSPGDAIERGWSAENGLEIVAVTGNGVKTIDEVLLIQHIHFSGSKKRTFALLVERGGAPVPELSRVIGRVQDSWRISWERGALKTFGARQAIRKCLFRTVAGSATAGPIKRQAGIKEKLLAQFSFGCRLRVIRRNGNGRQCGQTAG